MYLTCNRTFYHRTILTNETFVILNKCRVKILLTSEVYFIKSQVNLLNQAHPQFVKHNKTVEKKEYALHPSNLFLSPSELNPILRFTLQSITMRSIRFSLGVMSVMFFLVKFS